MLTVKKTKKVLLADDDESIRRLFTVYMESWGLETVSADNGINAIEMIKKESPDLIVLDLDMPELNGLQLCSILKDNKKTKKIPVAIMSGSSKNSDIENVYANGASAYFVKPINWDRFKLRVGELLNVRL